MASLLITGGRVLDPSSGRDEHADVAISGDQIAAIAKNLPRSPADTVIDAAGCLVTPGLIDPHVHLREPGHEHKETIATGSRAASVGGFTAVCCMPNTSPALDSPELVRFVYDRARTASCRVYPVAAATKGRKGEELTEILLLSEAGAVAFSDDGDCVPTAGMMSRVLTGVKQTGRVFMQHCQDPTMTRGSSMHAGAISQRLGLVGWPRAAEEVIIERDIRLNRGVGARYHVQHISSGESVDIVRRARAAGQPVTAEASPHHLLLTHEACDQYNTLAKVNPPLREKSDRDAIVKGVADGTITVLATDHAPHSADEKALPFEEAPMGLVGVEIALPLYAEALVHSGAITWNRLIELLTIEPARLCNLDRAGLGSLKVGGPADVTVINPDLACTISNAALIGKSKNSPFDGRSVRGRAIATICNGAITHRVGV
ncbi:MAG: dihydroorotase [Phycisphaerales bacterium]|nr:dihydroorotase [Phycisphaerales bacterium]